MSDSRPVFILSFDSLDFDLLRRWADAGYLPAFAKLISESAWSRVTNPEGLEAGTAWMSFITGVMPDEHGVVEGFYRFDPSTYEYGITTPQEIGWPAFWSRASQAGRRVTVVDVPYSFIGPEVNGIQVCDWLVHVSADHEGPKSNDPAVLTALERDFGLNPLAGPNRCPVNDQDGHTIDGLQWLLSSEEQRIGWKVEFCKRLLAREQWDLFVTTFHEAHDIGHMCWHVHDPEHDWHDPDVARAVGDPLLRIYRRLDSAVADLLEVAPPQARVLVYTSYGIGPERTANRLLDDLLLRLEQNRSARAARGWMDHATSVYRNLVPEALRGRLAPMTFAKNLYVRREQDRIRHRRFFALSPSYATGGVHFNVSGRESHGLVRDDSELDRLIEQVTADLSRLTNAETGEPLVDFVMKTSDRYTGSRRMRLPDLLVEWNKSQPIRRIHCPQLKADIDNAKSVRSGDHFLSKHGALFAIGRELGRGEQGAVHVTDIAATLGKFMEFDASALPGSRVPWLD